MHKDFLGSLDKNEQQKLFTSIHVDSGHYCQTFSQLLAKGCQRQTKPHSSLATCDITLNQG